MSRQRVETGNIMWSMASLGGLRVVNDLPQDFPAARLSVSLVMPDGQDLEIMGYPIDIPADSVVEPMNLFEAFEEGMDHFQQYMGPGAMALLQMEPGPAVFKARLHDAGGNLLSENETPVTFVAPMVPAASPF
jgi:hypothetical protein